MVWRLPIHASIAHGAAAPLSLSPKDGYIQVVNTGLVRELEQKLVVGLWGGVTPCLHLDLSGPPGAGKTTALYAAFCELLQKRRDARVVYFPHCGDWLSTGREWVSTGTEWVSTGRYYNAPPMLFWLCEFVRAFARDDEVLESLHTLIARIGFSGLVRSLFHQRRFLESLTDFLKKENLTLHLIVDAVEYLDGVENQTPFCWLENVAATSRHVRLTRCGAETQKFKSRHLHSLALWEEWAVEGSFGDRQSLVRRVCRMK